MCSYSTNSPEAAASIVTLKVLADGHLSQPEVDALHRQGRCERLGLECHQPCDVLLALSVRVVDADARVSDAAPLLPTQAVEHRGLRSRMLRPESPRG